MKKGLVNTDAGPRGTMVRAFNSRVLLRFLLALFLSQVFTLPFDSLPAKEPVRLKAVKIQGNLRLEEDGIRLHIKARSGDLFDPVMVDEDVKSIYRMGFFDDVRADLSSDGILTYVVKERPYIKDVQVQGNEHVSREKIEASFGVRPRTILDRDKVSQGVERVKKLYVEQGYANAKVDFAVSEDKDNQAVIVLDIVEGKRLLIKKISFEGNHAFSDSELKGLMATKEKWLFSFLTNRGVLDQDILTNDLAVLSNYYYDHGYINLKIDEPVILRRRDGMEVVIRVEEGDQYKVGKVEIGGDLIENPEKLLKMVKLTTGQIFRGSRLRGDIATLSERYADRGFAFARVEPVTRVDAEKKKVDVALIIKRGPPVYFNRVTIAGNTKTRDKVIRREMTLAEQELFSVKKIKESRNALMRTGYFKDVQLTTRKTDRPDAVDAVVKVKEGPTGTFSIGAGFSTGSQFFFTTSVSEQNLFGRGQSLSAAFDIGSIRQDFSLSFAEPYLFDSRLSLGVSAFNNRLEFDTFDSRRAGFATSTSYPLKYLGMPFLRPPRSDPTYERPDEESHGVFSPLLEHLRGGMAYELTSEKISGVDSDAPPTIRDEKGTSLVSSITPSLSYDSRNHFFTPTEGTNSNISLKVAGLGGDTSFLKSDASARWYYPLMRDPQLGGTYTLVLGGSLGYGVGFRKRANGRKNLPLFERYFPGGINSVRGFSERSLGPRENGDEVGGDKQAIMNVELQFPFPFLGKYGLRGATFFDQGQAFRESESINPGKFRRSVGLGARWLSPFGPLRVSLGFPLNKEPGDDTSVVGFSFGK